MNRRVILLISIIIICIIILIVYFYLRKHKTIKSIPIIHDPNKINPQPTPIQPVQPTKNLLPCTDYKFSYDDNVPKKWRTTYLMPCLKNDQYKQYIKTINNIPMCCYAGINHDITSDEALQNGIYSTSDVNYINTPATLNNIIHYKPTAKSEGYDNVLQYSLTNNIPVI